MKLKLLPLLSTLSLFLLPFLVQAQSGQGVLIGKVTDSLHQKISYATIQLKKLNIKTSSDKAGQFQLKEFLLEATAFVLHDRYETTKLIITESK